MGGGACESLHSSWGACVCGGEARLGWWSLLAQGVFGDLWVSISFKGQLMLMEPNSSFLLPSPFWLLPPWIQPTPCFTGRLQMTDKPMQAKHASPRFPGKRGGS